MLQPISKSAHAESVFKQGFNCAQAVLAAYAEELGLSEETASKIATGFGAGIGRAQEVCGAVSGAIMVIGLMQGRGKNDGREKTEATYKMVQEFINAFKKEHGTIICRELLPGCSLSTAEGQAMFREQGLGEKCCGFVKTASGILESQGGAS